jgi:phosphoserine phosphatase
MADRADPLIVTLMSAAGLPSSAIDAAAAAIVQAGGRITGRDAFDGDHAIDLHVAGIAQPQARAAVEMAATDYDVVVQPAAAQRRKRLLVADMDSTMITCECIDELADFAGLKTEIAAITERAMRGEMDFAEALHARVAALRGLPVSAIAQCLESRVRLMPGARILIQTMRHHGARTVLISGGFTAFTAPVASMIGFDRQIANTLLTNGDRLTGTVASPIIDAAAKRATLLAEAAGNLPATLAVGDGANDAPMLATAGLGIAYHAKPAAIAAAAAAIRHGDLTCLLWAQGFPRREWFAGDQVAIR